jgi:hypothetical protein
MAVSQTHEPSVTTAARRTEIETQEAVAVPASPHAAQAHMAWRATEAVNQTAAYLRERLGALMPASPLRDFYRWGLSEDNPARSDWLQVIGLGQIVQFCAYVSGNDVEDAHFFRLIRAAAPLNTYLNFEVISDDMAAGLMERLPDDKTYYQRSYLIYQFTEALLRRLRGEDLRPAAQVLAREADIASRVGRVQQTLRPEEHERLIQIYAAQHPGSDPVELDHALHGLLLANFEACAHVDDLAKQMQLGGLIRRGLRRRYTSEARVLRDTSLGLARVVTESTYSVLIIPVVAFYMESLAAALDLEDRLPLVTRDQLAFKSIYLTALLIRLLNDMGTQVMKQQPDERQRLIEALRQQARENRAPNIRGFFRHISGSYGTLLTRITKDVEHGEFNVALYNLEDVDDLDGALVAFGDRLQYFSQLYANSAARLDGYLEMMTRRLGDGHLSALLKRAVRFHEKMYAVGYQSAQGDYAV